MADMVYVTQSAGRILRAIFEIALKKGGSSVAKIALDLCKMAEKRMWPTMTPLRQFPSCPKEVVQKSERIDVPWSSYFDLDPPRMGELLGIPRQGRMVCGLVAKFPRVEIQAQVQPMTRSMLRVELTIIPNFEWDDAVHGTSESFWIIVEDCDGEDILYQDQFLLRKEYAEAESKEHLVEFTVPITDPMPPNYFISVISDRWMHSETRLAVSFQKLLLPDKFRLTRRCCLCSLSRWPPESKGLRRPIPGLGALQQDSDADVQFAVRDGRERPSSVLRREVGKTVCAEFALLRHWAKPDPGRAVYIAPFQELVDAS